MHCVNMGGNFLVEVNFDEESIGDDLKTQKMLLS